MITCEFPRENVQLILKVKQWSLRRQKIDKIKGICGIVPERAENLLTSLQNEIG